MLAYSFTAGKLLKREQMKAAGLVLRRVLSNEEESLAESYV